MNLKERVFVTMTDKFMSGWGESKGKINKLVFVCRDRWEAQIVRENAEKRNDMKDISIAFRKPYYPTKTHLTQFKTKDEYPSWYKEGYFSSVQ